MRDAPYIEYAEIFGGPPPEKRDLWTGPVIAYVRVTFNVDDDWNVTDEAEAEEAVRDELENRLCGCGHVEIEDIEF